MLAGWVDIITQKYSLTQQGLYPFKNYFAIHMANPKRKPEKVVESLKHSGRKSMRVRSSSIETGPLHNQK